MEQKLKYIPACDNKWMKQNRDAFYCTHHSSSSSPVMSMLCSEREREKFEKEKIRTKFDD